MMRVTVEIVPHGDETKKRTIATINLANVKDRGRFADYEMTGTEEKIGAFQGKVLGHMREHGWMPLVRDALKHLFDAWADCPPLVKRTGPT